jgi:hypothetical protein
MKPILQIPEPDKDTIQRENYRTISLMNINPKILKRYFEN